MNFKVFFLMYSTNPKRVTITTAYLNNLKVYTHATIRHVKKNKALPAGQSPLCPPYQG